MTGKSWARVSSAIAAAAVCPLIAVVTPVDMASAAGKGPILSPSAGDRLSARPFVVRIRTGHAPRGFQAQLNGHPIATYFSAANRRGVRRLRVSRSYGLRHGLNSLHIRLHKRHAKPRSVRVRFRIRYDRPLAGAGIDRDATVGDLVSVGAGSRSHLGAAAKAGYSNLHKSWEVLDAPRGSAADAGLDGEHRGRASIHPRVPGRYRLRLTVKGRDGKTGSDMVLVDARPGPLPRIDTMTEMAGGPPGISVGGQVYEAGSVPAGQVPWMQVVVLDRSTLGLISNQTYGCAPAPAFCSNPQLGSDLRGLNKKYLVIGVNHQGASWRPAGSPTQFGAIGGETYAPDQASNVAGGFSIIGVPGLPQLPPQADFKFVTSGVAGGGRMTGYLARDQWLNYTWLPKDRPAFDTRAASTCTPSGQSNEIDVGDNRSTGSVGGPPSGALDVEALNPYTLETVDHSVFVTNNFPNDPQQGATQDTAEVQRLTAFLNRPGNGNLIVITAFNCARAIGAAADVGAVNQLGDAVASAGGTRDLFLRSTSSGSSPYSLIGWARAGEGNGEETSKLKDPEPGDGRLRGALSPNHTQKFRPIDTSTGTPAPETLNRILVQPPSKWPLDGNEGAQKAIRWIGSTDKLKAQIGPDVRSAYWNQPFNKADWITFENDVKELKYPGSQTGFNRPDFLAAQAELAQEMEWVGTVRSYTSFLSQPFDGTRDFGQWQDLKVRVVNPIITALNPPGESTSIKMLGYFGTALKIAGAFGTPGFKAFVTTFTFGLQYLTQSSDGSDADDVRASADDLADAMVKRIQSAEDSFDRMGDIIVADYDKLRTVATNQRCNPTSPDCLPEWQFTKDDQKKTTTGVWKATEATFTEKFLNLTYPSYRLTPASSQTDPNARDQNGRTAYECRDGSGQFTKYFGPLQGIPGRAITPLEVSVQPKYDSYVLVNLDNITLLHQYPPNYPPTGILQRMFDPLGTSVDPSDGGLGIYAPDYFREANAGKGTFEDAYQAKAHGIDQCGWKR
jgi:hypothetical protein